MAITHNFKEGINWIADGTGETPLANHIFVSKSGNDTTGDGSPETPYLTIAKAQAVVTSAQTIIVGGGIYSEGNLAVCSSENHIIADGYVSLNGTLSENLNFGSAANVNFTGFIVKGYTVIGARWRSQVVKSTFINCDMIARSNFSSNEGPDFQSCKFINCNYVVNQADLVGNGFVNCIFINSTWFSGSSKMKSNNHIDKNSVINLIAGTLHNSNINGIVSLNGGSLGNGNIDLDPRFNNVIGFDFSVLPGSGLIGKGSSGSNIGGVFIGKGYFQGVSLLDTAIDANANIAYNSLGEIELQGGAGTSEVFTTSEEEALELSVLGTIRISGFLDLVNNTPDFDNALLNPNNLILEIDTALLDGIWIGYKKYRWNEQPTQNADGTPNGDSGYDWSDNNKIPYKKRRFRITLRSNYTQA